MERSVAILKTLGHVDRLRILALLSHGELTVSELVHILNLSQPRITQYIKSLETVGIIERLREGSWVFSRLDRTNVTVSSLVSTTLASLSSDDPQLLSDQRRLADVRSERSREADAFFANVANDRGQLGDEYLPKADIEAALLELAGSGPFDFMVDLGTGTGRMLEVFAHHVAQGTGIDNNADMLKVARHKLAGQGYAHLVVQQGDLTSTPIKPGSADLITLHQVLHYLDNPVEALREAARLLSETGVLLIVDFCAHQREDFRELYAHRRLGFSETDIEHLLGVAGLKAGRSIRIDAQAADTPAVRIWRAEPLRASYRKIVT